MFPVPSRELKRSSKLDISADSTISSIISRSPDLLDLHVQHPPMLHKMFATTTNSNAATTFHRFGDLPAELRIKVFLHAIDDLRPLRVWWISRGSSSSRSQRARGMVLLTQPTINHEGETVCVMKGLRILPFLQACSMSRCLLLEFVERRVLD